MNNKILRKAETYRKTHTKKKWLYRGLSVVAAGAVFCTTYALILPAITMESGTPEHRHDESCYAYTAETKVFSCSALPHEHTDGCWDAEGELICGYVDYFVHAHDETCYDEEGILLCELPEIGVHEHSDECFEPEEILLHEHTEECIGMEQGELICELAESEGHFHDDTCIGVVSETLICELTEAEPHEHTAECYEILITDELLCTEAESEPHRHEESCFAVCDEAVCGLEETEAHQHEESCFDEYGEAVCGLEETDGHQHEESCFAESDEIVCVLEETEGHSHSDECYGTEEILICETATEGHTHGEDCYEIVTDNTCGLEESEAHQHDESCYEWTEVLLCEAEAPEEDQPAEEESEPICGYDEVILHTHGEDCFDENGVWVCGIVEVLEHRHTEECFTVEITEYEEPVLICELEEYYRTAEDCAAEFAELVNTMPDPADEEYHTAYYTAFDAYAMTFDLYCEEHPETEGQEDFDAWLDELGYYDEYEYFAAMPDPNDAAVYDDILNIVQDVPEITGINVNVFNYNSNINTAGLGKKGYKFFHSTTNYGNAEDGDGASNTYDIVEKIKPTLNESGYPYTDDGSLEYLFTSGTSGVTEPYFMENGGGLFQKKEDGNGYYYDSAKNAAYYDNQINKFALGDGWVVSPIKRFADGGEDVQLGNFLPYNPIGDVNKSSSKTLNDGKTKAYALNKATDLWFGMTVDFSFNMPENGEINDNPMIFEFHGDDDVFVYIDEVLVLNIGGTHGAYSGTINFATGAVEYTNPKGTVNTTLYALFSEAGKNVDEIFNKEKGIFKSFTKHDFDFFYLERGGHISYCKLDFNLPSLPNESLTYGKQISVSENASSENASSELNTYLQESLEYHFRVLKANTEGEITNQLLVTEGTYDVLDKDNKVTGEVTVGENGIVTLKHGQWIQIPDMWNTYETVASQYYVQELIPSELKDQYEGVEWETDIKAVEVVVTGSDGETDEYFGYNVGPYSISETEYMTFTNRINVSNLSKLLITKSKAAGSGFNDTNIFNMKVSLGGVPIPVRTPYTLDDKPMEVEKEGIIPLTAGQTAVIDGIISGTEYEVVEDISSDDGYTVSYTGTVTVNNEATELPVPANVGSFPLASIVHVIVTNADYDLSASVPLNKTTYGLQENDKPEFEFTVTQVEKDTETDEWIPTLNVVDTIPSTYLTVTQEQSTTDVVIGYRSDEVFTDDVFHYRVEEVDLDGYICDDSWYIVKVTIYGDDETKSAEAEIVERNGKSWTNTPLEFTNYRSATLTVMKTVIGTSEGTFPFTVTMEEFNGYSCNDQTFNLKNGESKTVTYPIGATVTVTEIENAGYITSYTIDGSGDPVYSTTAEVEIDADGVIVHYTNKAGTELPSTGGIGTFPYTLGGLMIVGASAILFMYKTRRRQRG